MAHLVKCDGCGDESKHGQQWLRVRIEPFYPRGQRNEEMEVAYQDCMTADACGPQCAALALARQAKVLSGSYENMGEALHRTAKKLKTEAAPDGGRV